MLCTHQFLLYYIFVLGEGGLRFGTCVKYQLYCIFIKLYVQIKPVMIFLTKFHLISRKAGWTTRLEWIRSIQSWRFDLFRYDLLLNNHTIYIFYILSLGISLHFYKMLFFKKQSTQFKNDHDNTTLLCMYLTKKILF